MAPPGNETDAASALPCKESESRGGVAGEWVVSPNENQHHALLNHSHSNGAQPPKKGQALSQPAVGEPVSAGRRMSAPATEAQAPPSANGGVAMCAVAVPPQWGPSEPASAAVVDDEDECPVCSDPLIDDCMMGPCGHQWCKPCHARLRKMVALKCPLCNKKLRAKDVTHVTIAPEDDSDGVGTAAASSAARHSSGAHGTKIEAVVSTVQRILTEKPEDKVCPCPGRLLAASAAPCLPALPRVECADCCVHAAWMLRGCCSSVRGAPPAGTAAIVITRRSHRHTFSWLKPCVPMLVASDSGPRACMHGLS